MCEVLDPESFTKVEEVSESRDGNVQVMKRAGSDTEYRVKTLSSPFASQRYETAFVHTLDKIVAMGHPAISTHRGYWLANHLIGQSTAIVTDFEPNGSLEDILSAVRNGAPPDFWDPTCQMITIFGVAAALMYAHGCRIVHRNLKSTNVLFDENYEPKLVDFFVKRNEGMIGEFEFNEELGDTPLHEAPELLEAQSYNNKVDVYSFGMLVYQVFCASYPEYDTDDQEAIHAQIVLGNRPPLPKTIPRRYRKLISKCWSGNPTERPSFKAIVIDLMKSKYILYGADVEKVNAYCKKVVSNRFLIKDTVTVQSKKADLLQEQADNGDVESMVKYAHMLEVGVGAQRNQKEALKYYRMAAEQGNSQAQYSCGMLLGIMQQWKEAAEFYKIAADNGNREAQFHYALMLKNGSGVKQNMEQAAKYYKLAADQGDPDSQNAYGAMLKNGLGVEADKCEALKYFKMSAGQGDSDAQCNFGIMLRNGEEVEKDLEQAKHYFQLSANQGNCRGMNCLADLLMDEGEPKLAAYYYKMSADAGNSYGQNKFGSLLMQGIGVEKDLKEAAKYFKKSADQGDKVGQVSFGNMLKKGDGVPKNIQDAAKYYKLAADQGDSEAQYIYGKMLEQGNGVDQDAHLAFYYLQLSAESEKVEAENDVGVMLEYGIGTDRNYDLALKYLKRATARGYAPGQTNYAYMRMMGKGFSRPNKEKAKKYFELAAEQKYGTAMAYLGMLLYDTEPERAMTLIQEAVDQGNANGEYQLSCIKEKKNEEFMPLLESAAEKELPEAQFKLGTLKQDYEFIKRAADHGLEEAQLVYAKYLRKEGSNMALWYYKNAASSNDKVALYEIADFLADVNPAQGEAYVDKSAAQNYPPAFTLKGVFLLKKKEYEDAAHNFHVAATLGDLKGQVEYGLCYKRGLGVKKSRKHAKKYFKMAAEKNHVEALWNLGLIARKKEKAQKWFKLAADAGHAFSMYYYGMIAKLDGQIDEAVKYFEQGAQKNNEDCQFQLALHYRRLEDKARALEYMKLAASHASSSPASQFNYGLLLQESGDIREAARFMKLAAQQNDSDAQNNYGVFLKQGIGLPKDLGGAAELFRLSSEQGNSFGQNNYAVLLRDGEGVAKNTKRALELFQLSSDQLNQVGLNNYALMLKAAGGDAAKVRELFKMSADRGCADGQCNYAMSCFEAGQNEEALTYYRMAVNEGHLQAMNNLGCLLKAGKIVPKDDATAVKYFKYGAKQGHVKCMFNYAMCLFTGVGVTQNFNKAARYCVKAVDAGDAEAVNLLGTMYLTGRGTYRSKKKALKYFKQSAEMGCAKAQKNFERVKTLFTEDELSSF